MKGLLFILVLINGEWVVPADPVLAPRAMPTMEICQEAADTINDNIKLTGRPYIAVCVE